MLITWSLLVNDHQGPNDIRNTQPPLEMCAVGGLVRWGARSNVWRVKRGLHCPDCGARWSPMAKSAGFVSTSANSEGTSVNNVTLPGNILRHRQWRPNVRPTSANCPERTNMFVNFGYVGGESVYRGLSGNIGKRTQVLRDFSRSTSAIFVNAARFIVFYHLFIGNLTHTKDPRQTHDVSGVGRVKVCWPAKLTNDVPPNKISHCTHISRGDNQKFPPDDDHDILISGPG